MNACFRCGEEGHLAARCPSRASACGICDPRTRLIEHAGYMQRCPACHPLAGQPLPQHRRCGTCKQLICTWDTAPCDHHQPLTIHTPKEYA